VTGMIRCFWIAAIFISFVVAPSAAEEKPKASADKPKLDFLCSGTEPFWSVRVGDKHFEWELMGEKSLLKNPKPAAGMLGAGLQYGRVYRAKGATLYMVASKCSDGMSDTEYSYIALVDRKEGVYQGCCRSMETVSEPKPKK
jgi:uncharacterized membrane protein